MEDELPPFPRAGAWWAMCLRVLCKKVKEAEGASEQVLRAVENGASDISEVVEKRPRSGQEHVDTSSGDFDPRGDFDQPHPPGTGVTLTERIGLPATVPVPATRPTVARSRW